MSTLEAKKQSLLTFTGPMVAAATPYNEKGELDVSQIDGYVRHLVEIGVKGAYVIGTTGEGYSLAVKEKLQLVNAWAEALKNLEKSGKKLTVVINCSSTIVPDIHELAAEVERLGFDGVALLPPIYYQYPNLDFLINYLKSVATKSSPNTPLVFYHIPDFTGVLKFELHDFLERAMRDIPQFAGAKLTDYNIARYAQVHTRFGDRLKLWAGYEETLLATTAFGGVTAIGALFSLREVTGHYLDMVAAFNKHEMDVARKHQQAIALKCEELRSKGTFLTTFKEALNKELSPKGLHFGVPRAPIFLGEGSCPHRRSCCSGCKC